MISGIFYKYRHAKDLCSTNSTIFEVKGLQYFNPFAIIDAIRIPCLARFDWWDPAQAVEFDPAIFRRWLRPFWVTEDVTRRFDRPSFPPAPYKK
jgi:hypothetical protein